MRVEKRGSGGTVIGGKKARWKERGCRNGGSLNPGGPRCNDASSSRDPSLSGDPKPGDPHNAVLPMMSHASVARHYSSVQTPSRKVICESWAPNGADVDINTWNNKRISGFNEARPNLLASTVFRRTFLKYRTMIFPHGDSRLIWYICKTLLSDGWRRPLIEMYEDDS